MPVLFSFEDKFDTFCVPLLLACLQGKPLQNVVQCSQISEEIQFSGKRFRFEIRISSFFLLRFEQLGRVF